MDWSKAKTIFIIVFSILNIFLYSLYLNKYTTAQNVEPLGETTIEERLQEDRITYGNLPENTPDIPYAVGRETMFLPGEIEAAEGQFVEVVEGNKLHVIFDEPIPLTSTEHSEVLNAFIEEHVGEGNHYALWEANQEDRMAVFFQIVDGKTLYHSDRGKVIIHWNEAGEVVRYEQTFFSQVELLEQEKSLISAYQAVQHLYQRGMLPMETHIDSAELGYSTLTQVRNGTYMFVPTWRVSAELKDGTAEDYFVNAVEGGVIELPVQEPEETEASEE